MVMKKEQNNKDFFRLLQNNYPVILDMIQRNSHFTGRDEVINHINDFYNERDQGIQANSLFERMRDCGLLVKNHSLWSIPSYITLFIRKREGRSSYTSHHFVNACIQDIKTHIFRLESYFDKDEISSDELINDVFAIEDVYQQLSDASQNNCHKISMDVSSFQLDISLEVSSKKIDQFHILYDSYIRPMLKIVVDPDSEFDEVSKNLINLCDKILVRFSNRENFTHHLETLKKSIKSIQGRMADKILQAKNELDILFEVYREHRRIVTGINRFWEIKIDEKDNELAQIFDKYCKTTSRLKYLNPSDRALKKYKDSHLYGEKFKSEPPQIKSLNENFNLDSKQPSGLISFFDIEKQLKNEKEIECILSWLIQIYPAENASFYIEKLFEIEKKLPENITIKNEEKTYLFGKVQMDLKIRSWANCISLKIKN